MSGRARTLSTAIRSAAADWVVRLRAPEAGETDWLAFETWLAESPDARSAFDEAMAIWLLSDRLSEDDLEPVRRAPGSRGAPGRTRAGGMATLGLGGLSVAIAAVIVVGLYDRSPPTAHPAGPPSAVTYATVAGERRTVMLADGTRLDLGGGSRVDVSLDAHARKVAMAGGEVAFTVVHDPARPFTVTVGDRSVRDIGTEFDIRRAGAQIQVTVRRGEVAVAPTADASAAPIALSAGRQLVHDEATGASSVRDVPTDEVFAWKQGRLIYRDQPLRVVVEDLNRYFPHAVRIEDERVAAMRFTGVLAVDGEEATIRRLVALMPIEASRVGGNVILKAREENR